MDKESIKSQIRQYVLAEFLPGEPAESLTDDVRLMSEGILDSMATLRLVSFIDEQFKVAIPPHQIDADHLDTVDDIATTILQNT